MKLYVDSNIFLNYLFDEFGKITEFAVFRTEELLKKSIMGEHTLLTSDLTVSEIADISGLSELEVLKFLKQKRVIVSKVEIRDVEKANDISKRTGIHKKDGIHTAMALKNKCEYIVTRDIKDFKKVSKLIRVCKPEEL